MEEECEIKERREVGGPRGMTGPVEVGRLLDIVQCSRGVLKLLRKTNFNALNGPGAIFFYRIGPWAASV